MIKCLMGETNIVIDDSNESLTYKRDNSALQQLLNKLLKDNNVNENTIISISHNMKDDNIIESVGEIIIFKTYQIIIFYKENNNE